jgi:protein gp37
MDVPQQANSERADDQSLGRDKGQQPSKESKTRDVQGAEASRIECAPPSKMAPNRIASSQNAPDGEGCVEDSEHEGSGNHGEGHRSQFRHDAESDISDMLPQDLEAYLTWPLPNVWLGTSAERQKEAYERIPHLLKCPAVVRFLSCEPLLSGIDLSKWIGSLHDINRTDTGNPKAKGGGGEIEVDRESIRSERPDNIEDSSRGSVVISWIICGGESGPGARPMHPDWARSLRDQCQRAGVPFFFKQWGAWIPESEIPRMPGRTILGTISGEQLAFPVSRFENHCGISFGLAGKKNAGRLLDGREWNEMPETAGIAP